MKEKEIKNKNLQFAFTKKNYILLGVGVIFIIAGIFAMAGGEMHDESNMSSRRIILAPILIIIGFVINIFAILYSPKEK